MIPPPFGLHDDEARGDQLALGVTDGPAAQSRALRQRRSILPALAAIPRDALQVDVEPPRRQRQPTAFDATNDGVGNLRPVFMQTPFIDNLIGPRAFGHGRSSSNR